MIDSSRQARPTSTLRRTASATPSFNTNATDFSKQFGFQHLLNSPLPSPALPSIVPRHGKKPTPRTFRRAFRISARLSTWLLAITLIYWLYRALRSPTHSSAPVTYLSINVNDYSVAEQDSSPRDAAPVVAADSHKIPRKSQATKSFIDVQGAHDQGLLSGPTTEEASSDQNTADVRGNSEAQTHSKSRDRAICEKSLTFLMESADAGMGKTLLGLWMAYGLAREQGRAFFIDDSTWAYGRYTSFFKPSPVPGCQLPPATQRLHYPHQTRHLVVSTSTYQWVFGDLIEPLSYEHHTHEAATRKHRAFFLARAGHDALFHLTGPDSDYLSTRLAELDSTNPSHHGLTVGLHLRRGDRHPWEPQYSDSYIPPSTYLTTAQSLLYAHLNPHNTTLTHSAASAIAASTFLLASDDPDIYTVPEFSTPSIHRAQSHILLASKAALDAALPDPAPAPAADPAFTKFVEPNVGWEGGFFASIFWGLGDAAEGRRAARGERPERPRVGLTAETLRLREYVGRAYLLDLKVVGAASGGVVCGVSGFGCRVLGVMRGWGDVQGGMGWRNVDGGWRGWVGLVEGE